MISKDEDALICDLAETYQIYDYKQLPASKVAVFASGLRDDSRIKMKLINQTVSLENLLLAGISDSLNELMWSKTKDGQKGINKPDSMVAILTNKKQDKKDDVIVFDSGEDFVKMRNQLIGVGGE